MRVVSTLVRIGTQIRISCVCVCVCSALGSMKHGDRIVLRTNTGNLTEARVNCVCTCMRV